MSLVKKTCSILIKGKKNAKSFDLAFFLERIFPESF
jgi:hypothetical protein